MSQTAKVDNPGQAAAASGDWPDSWQTGPAGVGVGRYTDPQFLQLEFDRLWSRVWQVAARVDEIPEQGDFTTHVYNGHHGTIDHIFFSQEFYHRNPDQIGDLDYVRAFNDHLVDKDMNGAPGDRAASDHGQVVAYFSLGSSA